MTQPSIAIVTGSARGIGYAIAQRLISDGMAVAIADVDAEAAETAAGHLGEHAFSIPLDVTSPQSWEHAVEIVSERGSIDALVNCAGIAGRSAPSWELSFEEWQQVIAIDLTGVWLGCRAVIPGMMERGYGRIVNIASIAGKEGNPNASPYS
ncbi:MAG TPA: SDR family NAD(P)-dependent oxidoreductase, partial [Thermomicrobiales bacterium]|nr:SDR family NAD(P)-dependent oxidoreductase [Thermomicrobiales bacterium]